MMGKSVAELLICLFCILLSSGNEIEASPHSINSIFKHIVREKQPYRTAYHFQPLQNWMNDPNGPMYYKGVYHFFYQYNPSAANFGDRMVWAHSVSYDLINWIHLNSAIEPSEPYDINSCFSGSATILPGENPVILYSGISDKKHQVQNLATPKNSSDLFLREWIKHPQNPVMTRPDGVELNNFRDPTTAWLGKDGKWRVIVGAQKGNEGKVILYQSEDFVNWTVDPIPFYASNNTGVVECPDFFPLLINGTAGVDTSVQNPNVRHVLKISYPTRQHDYYFLGKYLSDDQDSFIPDNKYTGTSLDLRYDYGRFYASKTFLDNAKDRRILWGWSKESDTEQDDINKGWAGVQSIPRQVWLDKSGKRLIQWPAEEIETLRDNQISFNCEKLISKSILDLPWMIYISGARSTAELIARRAGLPLKARYAKSERNPIPLFPLVSGITALQADVEVVFEIPEPESAEWIDHIGVDPQIVCSEEYASSNGIIGPFGLSVLALEDNAEQTAIFFRIYKAPNRYVGLMCSDQSSSSLRKDLDKTTYGAFFDVDPNLKTISLRSLIDRSIIESFGEEGRVCVTSRVYPTFALDEKSAHLYVFNNGTQSVIISKLNDWTMNKAKIGTQETILSCS